MVLVDGVLSDPAPVMSVIGSLRFLILIGDIDQNVANSFLTSFADDTRRMLFSPQVTVLTLDSPTREGFWLTYLTSIRLINQLHSF